MPNDFKIGALEHPITENLSTVTVGGERTSLEISSVGNGARVQGDLEVSGNILGNILYTDLVADDILCGDLISTGSTFRFQNTSFTLDSDDTIMTNTDNVDMIVNRTFRLLDAGASDAKIFSFQCANSKLIIYDGSDDGVNCSIDLDSDGEVTISTTDGDAGTNNANLTLDVDGDITLDSATGVISLLTGGSTFTPTAASHPATKRYVDTEINCPSIPYYFKETVTSRTYFRDADDAFNAWKWDSYDTEDSTSVDDTITLAAANLLAGYVVGDSCTLNTVTWNTYQANAVSGVAHFQIWTADPSASATATLRTTDQVTSNRAHGTTTTVVNLDLDAGDMVLPGIQYVSGSNTIWYGGVTLQFVRQ